MVIKPISVLVQAESFANLDGWVTDQPFMDLPGSHNLMAHGMVVPVDDAVSAVGGYFDLGWLNYLSSAK